MHEPDPKSEITRIIDEATSNPGYGTYLYEAAVVNAMRQKAVEMRDMFSRMPEAAVTSDFLISIVDPDIPLALPPAT